MFRQIVQLDDSLSGSVVGEGCAVLLSMSWTAHVGDESFVLGDNARLVLEGGAECPAAVFMCSVVFPLAMAGSL